MTAPTGAERVAAVHEDLRRRLVLGFRNRLRLAGNPSPATKWWADDLAQLAVEEVIRTAALDDPPRTAVESDGPDDSLAMVVNDLDLFEWRLMQVEVLVSRHDGEPHGCLSPEGHGYGCHQCWAVELRAILAAHPAPTTDQGGER